MTLNLDARQRAMLQEMGYTQWWPQPDAPQAAGSEPAPARVASEAAAAVAKAAPPARAMEIPAAAPIATPAAAPAAIAPVPVPAAVPERPAPAPVPAPTTAASTELPTSLAPPAFALGAPVALFDAAPAGASPDASPGAGPGWLVVAELPPAAALASPRGELLRNLLRAMGLARHPRLWWVPLLRAPGQGDVFPPDNATTMAELARELQPGMVLLMGLPAARHLLQSSEPLGQLRGRVHRLQAGVAAVVSHDPAYLLRTPRAKADAWADACLALAALRNQK